MSGRDHIVPLGTLLAAVARELDAPRRAILAAEHHLALALRSTAGADGSARDLQSIDLAVQLLSDLQGFVGRLGEGLPSDLQVDAGPALRGLNLERLSAGLASVDRTPGPAIPSQPRIELF